MAEKQKITLKEINHYLHIYDYDDDIDCGRLCEEVRIRRKVIDLLHPSVECVAEIWFDGEPEEHIIKRRTLSKKKIFEFLLDKNVSLMDCEENVDAVLEYILDSDKEAEITYKHNSLGFVTLNDQLTWLAQTPIGGNLNSKKRASQYATPHEAEVKGSFDEWKKVVADEILGNTQLELGLAIGASAPIVHLLREAGVFSELPIWGIIGPSSQGKTTLLKVISAIYSSPLEGLGLLKDMNTTKVAFFKSLEGKSGLPLLFDEATGKADWSISAAVYDLSKGVERATCSSSRKLNPRSAFSGAIVISSENTLLKQKDINLGMLARVSEIRDVVWCRDADHSRRICAKFNDAHGTAVYPLIEHILAMHANRPDRFKEMFMEELAVIRSVIEQATAIDERIFNMYAGAIVGARIANEAWHMALDVDAIREFLVTRHNEAKPVQNEARKLYDFVLSLVNRHSSSFITKESRKQPGLMPSKVIGEIAYKDYKQQIWIDASEFEKFVGVQFPNYRQLLAPMHELNMIHKFGKKHFRSKHLLNIGRPYCYCFNVIDCEDEEEALKKKKQQKKKINLLADEDSATVKTVTVPSMEQSSQMQYLLSDSDDDDDLLPFDDEEESADEAVA